MKYLSYSILGFFSLSTLFSFGQHQSHTSSFEKCATYNQEELFKLEHPELVEEIEASEQALENFTALYDASEENQRSQNSALYVIPVVFHILHMNGDENISDDQVYDAIRIINEDYNARNSDLSEVINDFQSIIGNGNIEFRLAQIDPNGNPTNGIDRIQSNETYVGDDGSKLNQWSPDSYLNIWVSAVIGSGAAAYAYLPSTANVYPDIDGIICLNTYVGSIGTSSESGKHTLSHEIGHYLNLAHPWGPTNQPGVSSNCNTDDGVSDTPNTIGTSGSCNLAQVSCGSLDNIQNFMDYSSCDRMFTQGQINRMYATLNSNTADRIALWQNTNLVETGVADLSEADFRLVKPFICQLDTAEFEDQSKFGASSWNWSFEYGNPTTSTDQYPQIFYNTAGVHDVSLTASNSSSTVSTTKTNYILVNPIIGHYTPYVENFSTTSALPNDEWLGYNPYGDDYAFVFDASSGYDNDGCIKMENFGNTFNTEDELYSTTFDLSPLTTGEFTFKYAFAQTSTSGSDALYLFASMDCGETWYPRWSKSGSSLATVSDQNSSWAPSSTSDWESATIYLNNSYLSEKTMFKFVFESEGGNNLYLDDINITGTFSDIAVLEYPENGMTNRPEDVVLQWKASGGITSYEYQLDVSSNFDSPSLETGIKNWISYDPNNSDTEYETSNLINGQTYFWRVRYNINGVAQSWSDTWSFTVVEEGGVGIDEWSEENLHLSVFPNPTNAKTTLRLNLPQSVTAQVTVFDIYGSVAEEQSTVQLVQGTNHVTINSDEYAAGVYIVRVSIGSSQYTKRLVVY